MLRNILSIVFAGVLMTSTALARPGRPIQFGVQRPSIGHFILKGKTETRTIPYGGNAMPVIGDFIGDGISRIGVYPSDARYYMCLFNVFRCPQSVVTYEVVP